MIPPPPLVDESQTNTGPRLLLETFTHPVVGQSNTAYATPSGRPDPNVYEIVGRVREPDRLDLLKVRVFANEKYNELVPIDPNEIQGPGFADGTRPILLRIVGLCDTVLPARGFHLLELYVTDGAFAAPTGREVTATAARDSVSWRIDCNDPPPSGDGGP